MPLHAEKQELAPVAELYPPQGQWTEADYFALPDTNRYVELSEGRLIMPPHPTYRHQTALQNVFLKFQSLVDAHHLRIVRFAPLPVRVWPGKIQEPDIVFVAQEHIDRIGEQVLGVPDLVVEVISPPTLTTDRVEKFYEYARAGVREYWMADPEERAIEVYILREGAYALGGKYKPGETARSGLLPGFELGVGDILP
jgi:Uma2 family endonuclease